MHNKLIRAVIGICAGMMLAFALTGCAAQNSAANEAQAQNRQFMSTVNETMDELSERLDSFEEAVTRGDVVTMRTQADNAFKVLDSLESLEAPEALKDIKAGYVDGCAALEEALNSYIALYGEIESASAGQTFDYASYADRIKSIQDKYNEGIAKLEETDKKATEL